MTIPDAPYIQEAEQIGVPGRDGPEPTCPVCGSRNCDMIFLTKDGEVAGCEYCVSRVNIWDWSDANGGESE